MINTLSAAQKLPLHLDQAWDFFSNPQNLSLITPPSLALQITSALPPKMYEGMIITYSVVPVPPFRASWVSEITHLAPPHYFVDEQRVGPYSMWHHEHHLREVDNGKSVEVIDQITYKVPGGPISPLIHRFLVRPRLDSIFKFRREKLAQLFPEKL